MPDLFTLTQADYDREKTTFQVNVGTITEDNYNDIQTNANALATAISNITNGAKAQTQISSVERFAWVKPTDATVQRERKWLVSFRDNQPTIEIGAEVFVNTQYLQPYTCEIGCAALSSVLLDSHGEWIPGQMYWLAFKSAFEALVKTPLGTTVEITMVRHVGRNT